MLLLTRNPGKEIVLTLEDKREIKIVLCRIEGNQATIGIEADKRIEILRDNIKKRIK